MESQPADWKKHHANKVAELKPTALVNLAVWALRELIVGECLEAIQAQIRVNPQTWWTMHHFHWGMDVRNFLRQYGFGEKEFGIDNLDDYWVGLVEQAAA